MILLLLYHQVAYQPVKNLGGVEEDNYSITTFHWVIRVTNWAACIGWLYLIYALAECLSSIKGPVAENSFVISLGLILAVVAIASPGVTIICGLLRKQLFVREKEALILTI